mmetsp:Transcript_22913/g.43272  ORF Transcript_22913/g.43272 Transcript_22913/m.43272 type:complete len:813 (-) Transcript_22913:393-2831(-)
MSTSNILSQTADINRQLEQMVMSEEFEKELEDEINQVKELEHANRRFKVKIDMLEREKNTLTKKHDAKIDLVENKVTSLEEELTDWETQAAGLESKNRKTEEEWEAKLAEEKRRARETIFSMDKLQTKMKSLEGELEELKQTEAKIDEYEAVLGKLMERNEELERELKAAKDDTDMAHRSAELADRRRALKTKDLEEKIEEQRVMIEQQQETLDESVKTILKLYSLNNEKGDDLSVLSEEKLTDMARAMVPRLSSKRAALPTILDDGGTIGDAFTLNSASYSTNRPSAIRRAASSSASTATGINTLRTRELTEEVENLMQEQSRARSVGRNRAIGSAARAEESPAIDGLLDSRTETSLRARSRGRSSRLSEDLEGIDNGTLGATSTVASTLRPRSRGRDRTESIRQLTERARTPGRAPADRERSTSPPVRSGAGSAAAAPYSLQRYDPSGPVSDSRALVMVAEKESEPTYTQYGGLNLEPASARSRSRRRGEGGDRSTMTYNDTPYDNETSIPQQQEPTTTRPRSRRRGEGGVGDGGAMSYNDPPPYDNEVASTYSRQASYDKRAAPSSGSRPSHRDRDRDRDRDRPPHHQYDPQPASGRSYRSHHEDSRSGRGGDQRRDRDRGDRNTRNERDRDGRGGDHHRDHRGNRDDRGWERDDPYYRGGGGRGRGGDASGYPPRLGDRPGRGRGGERRGSNHRSGRDSRNNPRRSNSGYHIDPEPDEDGYGSSHRRRSNNHRNNSNSGYRNDPETDEDSQDSSSRYQRAPKEPSVGDPSPKWSSGGGGGGGGGRQEPSVGDPSPKWNIGGGGGGGGR